MNPTELRKAEAVVRGIIEKRQQPLEVERLIPADLRRVTVEEHLRFRETIAVKPPVDEIDEALADPIHDHRPQSAPKHKVNGVLGILDQIEKENSNRRFTT